MRIVRIVRTVKAVRIVVGVRMVIEAAWGLLGQCFGDSEESEDSEDRADSSGGADNDWGLLEPPGAVFRG